MNKQKGIPELRFPDFVHKGEWELRKLGESEVSIIVNEKVPISRLSVDSYISTENILSDFSGITKASKLPQSENLTRFTKNDILVSNIRPYLKKVWKAEFNGAASNDVIVFRVGSEVEKGFLEFLLKNEAFIHYVMKSAKGVKMPRGDKSSMQEYPVMIPPRAEQQKIAACLSTLDELITAHEEKLQTLKDHKKGLMQNLFPQEGEKVPRYRFKEFEKDGEWVEKTIHQIAKVTTGSKDTQNKVDGGKYPFFVRSQTVERINSYSFDGEAILTSGDGVGVGKNFHYINGKFDFHQRVYCIYDFADEVCGKFIFMYFSQHFNERVMKMSAKNSVDSVRMSMITEMPISLPSKKEQQKIASCLSAIDDLITSQADKIEQLKLHKKGLMQGLFPKIRH